MLCDIATEFVTTRNQNGKTIYRFKQIASAYVKSPFIFDIFACLPGLISLESSTSLYYLKIFRYLQMPRFFDQLDLVVRKLKQRYIHNAIEIGNCHMMFKTSFILLILFHTLACIWILIGGREEEGWQQRVLFDHQMDDMSVVYVNAFYFVTTTATTIGYGDIHASARTEKVFVVFLEFIGICIFSAITGNLRRLKRSSNMHKIIQDRIKQVQEFINEIDNVLKQKPLEDYIYDTTESYID